MATPKVPLTQVARNRLAVLSNFLRNSVPRNAFDLTSWYDGQYSDMAKQMFTNGVANANYKPAKAVECGTTACAVGWAASIPAFRRAGLALEKRPHSDCGGINFKGFAGFEACEKFFQITEDQALSLFTPEAYPNEERTTPVKVANRIDKLLADPVKYNQLLAAEKLD